MEVNESWQRVRSVFGPVNIKRDLVAFGAGNRLAADVNVIKLWNGSE